MRWPDKIFFGALFGVLISFILWAFIITTSRMTECNAHGGIYIGSKCIDAKEIDLDE